VAETWQGGSKVSDRSAGALWTRFELTYPEWKDLAFTDGPADLDETHLGLRVPRFLDYSRDELIRGARYSTNIGASGLAGPVPSRFRCLAT